MSYVPINYILYIFTIFDIFTLFEMYLLMHIDFIFNELLMGIRFFCT